MRRTPLALTAGLATFAAAAMIATSGSAQTSTAPTTLHLVSKSQKGVGFQPKGRFRQGSRFGFGDRVTGDDTGTDRGECTAIGRQALCTVVLRLSRGTLTGAGLLRQPSRNAPVAVTGGTGAYDGARGTALVTDLKNATRLTITLKP
jgi:hypothetical protein